MLSVLYALACAAPADDPCEWPAAPVAPDGVVEATCGWYTRAVGEHLYANVYVTEPEAACDAVLADGLALNAAPIYSAMSDDAPKWTYDVVAEAAGDALRIDITCADGTVWSAQVDVE